MKGIQVFSNEGPCILQGEIISKFRNYIDEINNNNKIVKIHWQNLENFFSRTTGPISTKLGTKYPWVKGIQVCSNKGPALFQGEIIMK